MAISKASVTAFLLFLMATSPGLAQLAPIKAAKRPPRAEESAEERQARTILLSQAYEKPTSEWPAPDVDPGITWTELGVMPAIAPPPDNPTTKAKVELGKQLFFEPLLSGSGQIACTTCHDPELGWSDGRSTSFGHGRKRLRRNAPGLMNVGAATTLFWDGRADSLEGQALAVMLNPDEMNGAADQIEQALSAIPEYRATFQSVFGAETVKLGDVAKSLAAFERSIVSGQSRFDQFLKGKTKALSDQEILGLDLFRGKGRCMNCHNGPNFSYGQFHDLGLSYYGRELEDLGRSKITGQATDVGHFRTPSLRNIAATAPYMHNGLFPLDGVLNMYNAGMSTIRRKPEQEGDPLFPTKSDRLKPLGLNKSDLADLRAFLETLTEPKHRVHPPGLDGLAKATR